MSGYEVSIFDCAGEFGTWPVASFAEALATVRRLRLVFFDKVVQVSNLDRCDYNTNGLTEDEQEEIDEAAS